MMIFRALILLLQGGMSFEKVEGFITLFIKAARVALFGGTDSTGLLHSEMFLIFGIIGVGFLTATFYSELVKEAVNDTLTPEKLVAALAKLFIGAMMICLLPEILDLIFGIVETMFAAATNIMNYIDPESANGVQRIIIKIWDNGEKPDSTTYSTLTIVLDDVKNNSDIKQLYDHTKSFCDRSDTASTWFPIAGKKKKEFEYFFDKKYGGIAAFNDAGPWWTSVVVMIVSMVSVWGTYFAVAKAVIEFTIFAFIAPVGIINLFGEDSRMVGIKYLKKLLAKGLTLVVMILLIAVCSSICSGMMASALKYAKSGGLPSAEDMIDDGNGNLIENPDPDNAMLKNGALTIRIHEEFDDLQVIFSAGVLAKCCIMQIAQVGLLLGAAKLTDEIFGS